MASPGLSVRRDRIFVTSLLGIRRTNLGRREEWLELGGHGPTLVTPPAVFMHSLWIWEEIDVVMKEEVWKPG